MTQEEPEIDKLFRIHTRDQRIEVRPHPDGLDMIEVNCWSGEKDERPVEQHFDPKDIDYLVKALTEVRDFIRTRYGDKSYLLLFY